MNNFESKFDIRLLDGKSTARLVTRLVKSDDGEDCFMIDTDFYNAARTALSDVSETLEFLRRRGSRPFQWCITNELHEAMGPELL